MISQAITGMGGIGKTQLADIARSRNDEVDQSGNYALLSPILPHVRSVAEMAEGAEVEQAGSLWNSLGYHIHDLADYAGAQAAYERALKIFKQFLPKGHSNIEVVKENLRILEEEMKSSSR